MAGDPQDPTVTIGHSAYRTLTLAGDGQVVASAPLQAIDDAQALRLARATAHGLAVELWDGLRFIEHFDADGGAA